ncbi:MAG TPA: MaoC family dehydratase N-terminal domain-containing protein [Burkholderiales bacterium]|nr:MaoC family dehydratase N-terminal domain-containing protein [Burkholderiales bacterium]
MSTSVPHPRDWIGRKESHRDIAAAWPVAALSATLDRHDPEPVAGSVVPPGWHWLYFLETTPASELAADGHARRGGFLPPVTLPRRMWAGGRMAFRHPIRVGDALTRESEVISVEPKQGRSGGLVFVTVRHTVSAAGAVAVIEEHDIVYREAAKPGEAAPQGQPAPAHAVWRRELEAGPVMLFRFSALIFNAHRIHYDVDYCRDEGYPALVVHGPLQTLLLLDLCMHHASRPVKRLEYRALHPIFHTERFTVNGAPVPAEDEAELWTANAAGYRAMTARVSF